MNDKKTFTGGYYILLAEDDKMNQVVVSGLIKTLKLGRVEIAANGKEAVNMFCSHRFDLILMDGEMPEMNGIDAALKIRAIEKEKNLSPTPIIALTAHTTQEDRDLFFKSGVDDFVTKPLNPEQFKQAVQQVVRKSSFHGKSHGQVGEKTENIPDLKGTIDVPELKRIMTGKASLLDKCLQTFESTFPDQIENITRSIEKNEHDGLKKSAHRLKGMLKYLAAHKAVTLVEQLESMAVSENTTKADITVQALNEECLKIIDSIRLILERDFS